MTCDFVNFNFKHPQRPQRHGNDKSQLGIDPDGFDFPLFYFISYDVLKVHCGGSVIFTLQNDMCAVCCVQFPCRMLVMD